MVVKRSDGVKTRQKLLESAAGLFARKGYHDATVSDICKDAGANIAAINYYFGSKEELYTEAWRYAFDRSIKAYPADGGVPATASAEERMKGRIRSVLKRILDHENLEFDIACKEMANPTGLLHAVMFESLDPMRLEMTKVVRDLMGPEVPERDVQLCEFSVMAQCIATIHHVKRLRAGMPGAPEGSKECLPAPLPLVDADPDEIAEHIYSFSLAGMRDRNGKKSQQ